MSKEDKKEMLPIDDKFIHGTATFIYHNHYS